MRALAPISPELRQRRNLSRLDVQSPRRIKTSLSLRLLHQVMHLDHLHYGLWQDEELDFEGLRHAQERYSRRLMSRIPPNVRTIIDVGSGTGGISAELARRGFEVEGLAPDPYQAELFLERVGCPFHLCRFQEWQPHSTFDLVLMSESAQYIWLESLFPTVKDVAPGGYLLIGDYFRRPLQEADVSASGHRLDRFLELAEVEGLELELQEDVTEEAVATLQLGREFYDRHLRPAIEIFAEEGRSRHPKWSRVVSKLAKKPLAKLEMLPDLLDPDQFRRTKCYQFLRFRVPN